MSRVIKKVGNKRGESLAEVLVAILICAIGILLMSTLIYTATNLVNKSDRELKSVYDGMSAMETKENATGVTSKPTQLTVQYGAGASTSVNINIDIYEDGDSGLASYEKHE